MQFEEAIVKLKSSIAISREMEIFEETETSKALMGFTNAPPAFNVRKEVKTWFPMQREYVFSSDDIFASNWETDQVTVQE